MAIVGAGIHGAALARELSLRGVSCALIDVGEVGGGTSQWSTKLLHGGIRYLRTGDVAQMRAGLRERATWMRLAPWRCWWEAFWMPHRTRVEGVTHRLGIGLYDRWGRERPGWPRDLRLGRVPDELFRADPRSKDGPFRAAVAYADLMTWDRELTRDLAASSHALGYDFHEITDWRDETGEAANGRLTAPHLVEATLKDRRTGTTRTLQATHWVFALGPWMDEALSRWFDEPTPRLRLSAGIHLWFDPVEGCERPWTVMRDSKRVLFLIPRDGYLQAGTTEREVTRGAEPVTDAEREDLYSGLEQLFPALPWREMPVRHEESGVRSLVRAEGATLRLSREARLERYPRFANVRLILGGKLTTARHLMDRLATELTGQFCPASRTVQLKQGAPVESAAWH